LEITNQKISISAHIFNIKLYNIKIIRIYFSINHYENKIGYYKHICFSIILHENQSFLHFYIFFLKCWHRLNERRGLTWKHCLVYVDDVIIWSKDFESHLQHLDLVFQRLRMANLVMFN
jgi:hypothetical protein